MFVAHTTTTYHYQPRSADCTVSTELIAYGPEIGIPNYRNRPTMVPKDAYNLKRKRYRLMCGWRGKAALIGNYRASLKAEGIVGIAADLLNAVQA